MGAPFKSSSSDVFKVCVCNSLSLPPLNGECDITPVSFSDHSAVSFTIQSNDFIKRGPGFFKFNNSLLNDHCFVEELNKKNFRVQRKIQLFGG